MIDYFDEVDIFTDGWMFLLGGSNSVKKYWVKQSKIPEEVLSQWNKVYKIRLAFFKENNITYLSTFAPEKLTIYPEKTHYIIEDEYIPSLQLIDYLNKELGQADFLVNLIPYLRSQSAAFLTYHKTDSHWNFYGAFSAYQMIQARLGEPVYTDALTQPKNYAWGVLDLGGKFVPPLKEKVFYYKSSGRAKRIYANELVQKKERENRENDVGLHVGSYVIYENTDYLSDKTLMIFGDSFSEYRDHLLTGLMAETYKEVHFIWNSNIDFELIIKVKPDIVISELAERFLVRCNTES